MLEIVPYIVFKCLIQAGLWALWERISIEAPRVHILRMPRDINPCHLRFPYSLCVCVPPTPDNVILPIGYEGCIHSCYWTQPVTLITINCNIENKAFSEILTLGPSSLLQT